MTYVEIKLGREDPIKCITQGEHEFILGEVMIERDAAEKALASMYHLVMGQPPEWSNVFGYREALEEVELYMDRLSGWG